MPAARGVPVRKEELFRNEVDERSAAIASEYNKKKPTPEKSFVGPAKSLREHVLRLSLFPNIYNRSTLLSEM
jgi:hypothetical protein